MQNPHATITEAIRRRVLLQFIYNGQLRIVAPYCFGVSAPGNDVLRAIEVRGSGASNAMGKLWKVSQMADLRLLDETFSPNDPNYNPNDSAMKQIYARV